VSPIVDTFSLSPILQKPDHPIQSSNVRLVEAVRLPVCSSHALIASVVISFALDIFSMI